MANGITIIDAPLSLYVQTEQLWWLDFRSVSGGISSSGREQVIANPSPVWRCKFTVILTNDDNARRWRAFIATIRGRSHGVRLRADCQFPFDLFTRLGAPFPDGDDGIPFSDDSYFSDDSGFERPTPILLVDASVAAYADTFPIDMQSFTHGLEPGDFIGIAGHLYMITAAETTNTDQMTISIEPPLRVAASPGNSIRMYPTVVMRLTTDDQGSVTRTNSPMATPSIEMVELPEQI